MLAEVLCVVFIAVKCSGHSTKASVLWLRLHFGYIVYINWECKEATSQDAVNASANGPETANGGAGINNNIDDDDDDDDVLVQTPVTCSSNGFNGLSQIWNVKSLPRATIVQIKQIA